MEEDLSCLHLEAVAKRTTHLFLQRAQWIPRRVEAVSFRDESAVRRSVTLSITIPGEALSRPTERQLLVPLGLFRKDSVSSLEVVNEAGDAVATLTRRQSGLLAAGILRGAAEAILGHTLDDTLAARLTQLAIGAVGVGRAGIRELLASPKTGDGGALVAHAGFRALSSALSERFMLTASLSMIPGHRRVLRFEYDVPIERITSRDGEYFDPLMSLSERKANRLIQWTGLRGTHFVFPTPSVGEAENYHFKVTAPEGLRVVYASFADVAGGRIRRINEPMPGLGPEAHLLSEAGEQSSRCVIVAMRPAARAWLRVTAVSAATIALGFVLGNILAPVLPRESPDRLQVVPLLIAIPGFLLVLLARPLEHPLTSLLVKGSRMLIFFLAILSYLAAFLVLTGPELLPFWWAVLTLIAVVIATILLWQYAAIGREQRRVREMWRLDRHALVEWIENRYSIDPGKFLVASAEGGSELQGVTWTSLVINHAAKSLAMVLSDSESAFFTR